MKPVFPESGDDSSCLYWVPFSVPGSILGFRYIFSFNHQLLSPMRYMQLSSPLALLTLPHSPMLLNGLRETSELSWSGLFRLHALFHSSLTTAGWIYFSINGPFPDHLSSLVNSLICVHSFLHTSAIYWVSPLCHAPPRCRVAESRPSSHLSSSGEKDVCSANCTLICAVLEGNIGCCGGT